MHMVFEKSNTQVTYYRYMRLYPASSRVLFVTTTLEPSQSVVLAMDFDKVSSISADCSGILSGVYSFTRDGNLGLIEANLVDKKRPGMNFEMEFKIGGTRRKVKP
jgi:hypothetical protein